MQKSTALLLIWLTLLTGCASAPRVLVQAICPAIPELDQPPAAQAPAFGPRMQLLLGGKLPEPISYELTSPSARPSTTWPATP